jgi:hypothetical protein
MTKFLNSRIFTLHFLKYKFNKFSNDCEMVLLWSLIRHGGRRDGVGLTNENERDYPPSVSPLGRV